MFFKSCNCNSSIATRVGFAVRNLFFEARRGADRYCLDHLLFELNVRMAHEDTYRDQAN